MNSNLRSHGVGKGGVSLFDNLITFDELLTLFKGQIPRETVYTWIYRQGLPKKRIGRHLFFDRVEVERWAERKFTS